MTGDPKRFRYQRLAQEIEHKILDRTYRPGDKLPSVRMLGSRLNLSTFTVYQAYLELEAIGLVEVRSKSGYYVAPISLRDIRIPAFDRIFHPPREIKLSAMINSVMAAINNPDLLPLASTTIDVELLPYRQLARILKNLSHAEIKSMLSYSLSEGDLELRRQLALWYLGFLEGISPDDIIITNGCMEAITLSLLAVVRAGDTIAIESPTNFSFLQLLKELGILVVEVPTDPLSGVDIDELRKVVENNRIRALLLMPNFHNPLGAVMPDEKKKNLVYLANSHDIPIIEDDISGELFFEGKRPLPLKAFDRKDLVLTCSSFSKTLAPGLRIGWIIPGKRLKEKLQSLKAGTTVSTSTLNQHLLARFLSGGAYERHLRSLRKSLKKQVIRTALALQKYLPPDIRIAVPRGGSLLWVQLDARADSETIYQEALERGVSIIPGVVCSNSGQYRNCIQVSCGSPFTREIEKGIEVLGAVIRETSLSSQMVE